MFYGLQFIFKYMDFENEKRQQMKSCYKAYKKEAAGIRYKYKLLDLFFV